MLGVVVTSDKKEPFLSQKKRNFFLEYAQGLRIFVFKEFLHRQRRTWEEMILH
jgi:hypothetical protein